MSKPPDLLQGTLDLLILKMLALEPMHGWAIGQRLKQVSNETLQVSVGSSLSGAAQAGKCRLDSRGMEAEREQSTAKFYSLTRLGRKHSKRKRRRGMFVLCDSACDAAEKGLSDATGANVSDPPIGIRSFIFPDRQLDAELQEELHFHIDQKARQR